MRVVSAIFALFLSGCAARYSVQVPLIVPAGRSSYESGCGTALARAIAVNADSRRIAKAKGLAVYPAITNPPTALLPGACTAVLEIVGIENANYRTTLEESEKRKNK